MLGRYADDVTAAYAHLGLREVGRRIEGEWAAVALGMIRLAVRVARAHADAVLES